MSKMLTIDELIPLLKKGWVACGQSGVWRYFRKKPHAGLISYEPAERDYFNMVYLDCFNIAPYQGDWKESLRRVK